VHPDGGTKAIAIDRAMARGLYEEAFEAAKRAGFAVSAEPLRLTPQDKLVAIVRKSQELALAGEGGEEEETSDSK
jgi:CRISPR-associated protein Csb1